MTTENWPEPPIWFDDLANIVELLGVEEASNRLSGWVLMSSTEMRRLRREATPDYSEKPPLLEDARPVLRPERPGFHD